MPHFITKISSIIISLLFNHSLIIVSDPLSSFETTGCSEGLMELNLPHFYIMFCYLLSFSQYRFEELTGLNDKENCIRTAQIYSHLHKTCEQNCYNIAFNNGTVM